MTTIGAHMIIRNGDIYDFPWREGILSVLPFVDEFVLLEAYSDKDDTYAECLKMAMVHEKIRVIRGEWDGDEPEGYEFLRLSRLTNQCIDEVRSEWQWQVQGDECYHEREVDELLRIMKGEGRWGSDVSAIMVPFHHFVGNYQTIFPFVYQAALRIARKDSGWRSSKDAWNMEGGDSATIVHAGRAHCYHYGFTGDPVARLEKEFFFQKLFTSQGFPDPKIVAAYEAGEPMNTAVLFEDAKSKGLFMPFTGTHPAVMQKWIADHRKYEEVFSGGQA